MRILFVGMHNKPGLQPLDSSTKSGKLIDRLIAKLKPLECIKTNLYDSTEWPKDFTDNDCMLWWIRVNAEPNDIIVTLGDSVHQRFKKLSGNIQLGHPSAIWAHDKQTQYIRRAKRLIKHKLSKNEILLRK